jgi:hypothetical protein
VCVKPQDVDAAAGEPVVVNEDSALFANTGESSDTVVRPTNTGVETYTSIRGPDAPESYTWTVASPSTTLRATRDGGAELIDPDARASEADAGPKPPDRPVTADQVEDAVASHDAVEGAQPGDPQAAAAATAAPATSGVSRLEPSAELQASGNALPSEPGPADAPATTEAEANLAIGNVDATIKHDSAVGLADARSVASSRNQDESAMRESDDQQTLDQPVQVARIQPPTAVDATGAAVPTHLTVDGDKVTMTVDHQGRDVAYPVVADPWVAVHAKRYDWVCCRPVYRWETRSWREWVWQYTGNAPGIWIWQHHPRWDIGGNWYIVDFGNTWPFFRYLLMHNEPISPVYVQVPVDHFYNVQVYDHDEWYQDWVDYIDHYEWNDDPYDYNDYPPRRDRGPADPDEPEGDPVPPGGCTYDPEDPQDSADCGADYGSIPAVAAARLEPDASAAAGFGWGISDQQAFTFADSDYKRLGSSNRGLRYARLIVPWDLMTRSEYTDRRNRDFGKTFGSVKNWLSLLPSGTRPLISFGDSFVDPSDLPSLARYEGATNKFRERFKQVTEYTAWNEPNYSSDLNDISNAKRAGQYWRRLHSQCRRTPGGAPRCLVAAGDLADKKSVRGPWFRRYLDGMGNQTPEVWAWHSYEDGKRRSSQRLRTFLRQIQHRNAPVWLSEQGGIVRENGVLRGRSQQEAEDKALADARTILKFPGQFPGRIKRFYYYQWRGDSNWDSGLTRRSNALRDTYNLYRGYTR